MSAKKGEKLEEELAALEAEAPRVELFATERGWEPVCRACCEAEGWVRTTRRLQVPGGHLYQTETQQAGIGVSQALAFVPAVR